MKIYLDIDGVLITSGGKPSPHVYDLLSYLTSSHDCYWLTTHCRFNDSDSPIRYLEDILPECVPFMKKIKGVSWDVLKTEAIDFDSKFIWLDDYLMQSEEKVLNDHNARDGHIKVNLKKNPDQLMEILEAFENGDI
jgi:hypothetical protein